MQTAKWKSGTMAKTRGVIAKSMAKSSLKDPVKSSLTGAKAVKAAKSAMTKAKNGKHKVKYDKLSDRDDISKKIDRDTFHILHAVKDFSIGELHKATGMAHSTIQNLYKKPEDGGTQRPGHKTLARLAHAAGLEYDLCPIGQKQYIEVFDPSRQGHYSRR
jgi:hypothetical protein